MGLHLFQEGDFFAPSIGRYQLRHQEKTSVSTPLGLCCTCFFIMMSVIATGLLIAGVTGTDEFVHQSMSLSRNTVSVETGSSVPLNQFIVAYDLSIGTKAMLGAFIQKSITTGEFHGLQMGKCSDIYSDDLDVLALINSNSAMCIDPTQI